MLNSADLKFIFKTYYFFLSKRFNILFPQFKKTQQHLTIKQKTYIVILLVISHLGYFGKQDVGKTCSVLGNLHTPQWQSGVPAPAREPQTLGSS